MLYLVVVLSFLFLGSDDGGRGSGCGVHLGFGVGNWVSLVMMSAVVDTMTNTTMTGLS